MIQGIRTTPIYQKQKPERNPKYLAFIRRLPCVACLSNRGVEASHFGPHGIGQKSSDLQTLPLCHKCHRTGPNAYHKLGPRRFAEFHNLDPQALIQKFNTFWEEKMAA